MLPFARGLVGVVQVVAATVATLSLVVADRRPTPSDDCRPVARRFNDSLKTQRDQLVYDRKTLGQLLSPVYRLTARTCYEL